MRQHSIGPGVALAAAEDADRRQELARLLADHAGTTSAVARAPGKGQVRIRRWLARYGLGPSPFRRSQG